MEELINIFTAEEWLIVFTITAAVSSVVVVSFVVAQIFAHLRSLKLKKITHEYGLEFSEGHALGKNIFSSQVKSNVIEGVINRKKVKIYDYLDSEWMPVPRVNPNIVGTEYLSKRFTIIEIDENKSIIKSFFFRTATVRQIKKVLNKLRQSEDISDLVKK